jgi:hypothetical protein
MTTGTNLIPLLIPPHLGGGSGLFSGSCLGFTLARLAALGTGLAGKVRRGYAAVTDWTDHWLFMLLISNPTYTATTTTAKAAQMNATAMPRSIYLSIFDFMFYPQRDNNAMASRSAFVKMSESHSDLDTSLRLSNNHFSLTCGAFPTSPDTVTNSGTPASVSSACTSRSCINATLPFRYSSRTFFSCFVGFIASFFIAPTMPNTLRLCKNNFNINTKTLITL